MVKQQENYISNKKRGYLRNSIIWGSIVLIIFLTGVFVTKQRTNYFTLVAGVLVIPLSLNLTRYISFMTFNSPKKEHATILNQIKGDYYVYHGVVIPDAKTTHYFDHVILTGHYIYFIAENKETIEKVKNWIIDILSAKGITQKQIKFLHVKDEERMRAVAKNIEKEIRPKGNNLDAMSEILEAMIM